MTVVLQVQTNVANVTLPQNHSTYLEVGEVL